MDFKQRFLAKVKKTRRCWLWIGSKCAKGYGRFGVGDRPKLSHRVSWEIFKGPIPAGLLVLHRCDNPSCVKPAHLFVGTQLENMRDMYAKNRASVGERHYNAKLKTSQVLEIRKMCSEGASYGDAAKLFAVQHSTIAEIVRREIWKHV